MIRPLATLTFVLAGAALSPAVAAEPAGFTEASARWAGDGSVDLAVTYDGGACEKTGEAEVRPAMEDVDEVIIPTVATAEVCTMQIVPVSYSGTIPVEPGTTSLSVTVLDPKGQPTASGSVEIEAAE